MGFSKLGAVVFEDVQQLIATGKKVDGPGLDFLSDAGVVVLNLKQRFDVSARATFQLFLVTQSDPPVGPGSYAAQDRLLHRGARDKASWQRRLTEA